MSYRLVVGYYQSKQTAESILKYILQTYQNKKIGAGFDMCIQTYCEQFVKYESGKLFIKIGKEVHEIRSSTDGDEFTRISKSKTESIKKWSM